MTWGKSRFSFLKIGIKRTIPNIKKVEIIETSQIEEATTPNEDKFSNYMHRMATTTLGKLVVRNYRCPLILRKVLWLKLIKFTLFIIGKKIQLFILKFDILDIIKVEHYRLVGLGVDFFQVILSF